MPRSLHLMDAATVAAAVFTLAYAPSALACACCAAEGHRLVKIESLKDRHLAEIGQLRFAGTAQLAERADTRLRGIADPATRYTLEVTRTDDRFRFALRDEKGRAGTLAFRLPNGISIFEVDPRGGEADKGLGPTLYKEWKVTAYTTAGEGVFKPSVTRNTKIDLVLHGRGNACTSAGQFNAWTMQVYGPASRFTLYGTLDSAGK